MSGFKLFVNDITSTEATVNWTLTESVIKSDLDYAYIKLFKDGRSLNYESLNQVKPGVQVFQDEINLKNYESCYSFSGLDPATVYRVEVRIEFKKVCRGKYPMSDGLYIPLQGKSYVITNQQQVFKVEDKAPPTKVKVKNASNLCLSEQVLVQLSDKNLALNELFDFESDHLLQQSLSSEVIAARQSKGWKDFIDVGKRWGDPEDKSKRVRRALMVGKAMEVLEHIPVQDKGFQFMNNTWGQGPFYSWDQNFKNM